MHSVTWLDWMTNYCWLPLPPVRLLGCWVSTNSHPEILDQPLEPAVVVSWDNSPTKWCGREGLKLQNLWVWFGPSPVGLECYQLVWGIPIGCVHGVICGFCVWSPVIFCPLPHILCRMAVRDRSLAKHLQSQQSPPTCRSPVVELCMCSMQCLAMRLFSKQLYYPHG